MCKYLITGPTGTLGINLILELLKGDSEIWAVCNPKSTRINKIPTNEKVHIVLVDMTEFSDLFKIVPEIDVVINMAWAGTVGYSRNNMHIQLMNIKASIDLFDSAKRMKCKVFVGAGSQAEYGRKMTPICEGDREEPETGYGIAKLTAYRMLLNMCKETNIRFLWPRFFSVFGPYENHTSLIISTIDTLLDGENPKFTEGIQMWDYIYVKDAINILLGLVENENCEGIFNISGGEAWQLKKYIELIYKEMNVGWKPKYGDIPYSDFQVMFLCGDMTKVQKYLGERNKTSFETGIRETIKWCIEEKKNNDLQM